MRRDLPRRSAGCTVGHFVRRFRAVLWSAARGVLPDALCARDPFERAGRPWELFRPTLPLFAVAPPQEAHAVAPCHATLST